MVILSRGLNFCPTPKEFDRFDVSKDLVEFGRKMKCKACFESKGRGEERFDRHNLIYL